MKTKFILAFAATAAITAGCLQKANAQLANQQLSNLISPTELNVQLLPGDTNVKSLGSASHHLQTKIRYETKYNF